MDVGTDVGGVTCFFFLQHPPEERLPVVMAFVEVGGGFQKKFYTKHYFGRACTKRSNFQNFSFLLHDKE